LNSKLTYSYWNKATDQMDHGRAIKNTRFDLTNSPMSEVS
jgi:hypothetical protein